MSRSQATINIAPSGVLKALTDRDYTLDDIKKYPQLSEDEKRAFLERLIGSEDPTD